MATNIIPKKIHYCWFGNKKMSSLNNKCIKSWKKYLPDYEFILWNEKNFDFTANKYCHEAYVNKKYAFVSDYVRLYVLEKYGGIYFDTDLELFSDLNAFLKFPAFMGFESETKISTAIIGSIEHHPFIVNLLSIYKSIPFVKEDGLFNLTTNVEYISKELNEIGFVENNQYQILQNNIHLFPKDYFSPKSWDLKITRKTKNTVCVHHFEGSWRVLPPIKFRLRGKIKKYLILMNLLGVVRTIKSKIKRSE